MSLRHLLLIPLAWLLFVGCGQGESLNPTASSFATRPRVLACETFSVTLQAGWNCVGFRCASLTAMSGTSGIAGMATWNGTSYVTGSFTVEQINAGEGTRRAFWVYATAPTTFSYTGTLSPGATLNLRSGWNLAACPTSQESLPGSALSCQRQGQTVPLGSFLLTTFYAIGPGSYTTVDVAGAGLVRPGQGYWIFALEPVTLSYGGGGSGGAIMTVAQVQTALAAHPEITWKASQTSLSNYSYAQLQSLLGVRRSAPPDMVARSEPAPTSQALPATFVWTNKDGKDWTTLPKNQGPTYGTCHAFATIGALETEVKLYFNDSALEPDLSEWYLTHNINGLQGIADVRTDLASLKSAGTVEEHLCPYSDIPTFNAPPTNSTLFKITDWGSAQGVEDMKAKLMSEGPMIAEIELYEDWAHYGSDNSAARPYRPLPEARKITLADGRTATHQILIVGWEDASQAWICKNSAGPGWGWGGFFSVPYGSLYDDGFGPDFGLYIDQVLIVRPSPSPSPSVSPTPAPSPSPGLVTLTTGEWQGTWARIPITATAAGLRFLEDRWSPGHRLNGEYWRMTHQGGSVTIRGEIVASGPIWSYEDYTYSIAIRDDTQVYYSASGTLPKTGGSKAFQATIAQWRSTIRVDASITGGNPDSSTYYSKGEL